MLKHQAIFRLMQKNLQVESFLQNAAKLYSWEQFSRYPDFQKSAAFCVEALQKAGFSEVESIPVPGDGVTAFRDHISPQAWDRTGRCTLEILSAALSDAEKMLSDTDRHPLEVGMWSPPTGPAGLTGEVINGDALGDHAGLVQGKFVYTSNPPQNKLMLAWSKAGAKAVICTRMEAAEVAPDEICWVNGGGHYGWYYCQGDRRLPVFVLTPRRALFLTDRLQKGPVKVRGIMKSKVYDGTLPMVTARIPGDAPEELLLIAHIYEPFLADDAGGFAGCIEVGRLLRQLAAAGKIHLRRSLRVVFMMELYGLYAFLADTRRSKNIFAAQNLDIFCSKTYSLGGLPLNFSMSPVCNPFFGDVLEREMLSTLLPDVRIQPQHSALQGDTQGGDPDLDIPTLWLASGLGKYHHNTHAAYNDIDAELAPRLLALIAAYSAEMLCAEPQELKATVLPGILQQYRGSIREVRQAGTDQSIDLRETHTRLNLARHFAAGRLRSLNKLQPGLVSAAEVRAVLAPVAALWQPPAAALPVLTPWEAQAGTMILQRCQRGVIPFSLARVPQAEKVLWPCVTNRLILPLSDGKRTLLEALRMQRYSESIPVQPFTDAELEMYIDFARYLEKYGYVTIKTPKQPRKHNTF